MNDVRTHVRHCFLYEFQQGHTAVDATRNICTFVAPDALSYSMAKYWFYRFRQGNLSLEDCPRSGRPSTIDLNRLQGLVQADPTRTTRDLAHELQISHSTVERHLHSLGMRFHAGRWVYFGNAACKSRLNVNTSYEPQLTSSKSVSAATSTSSNSSAWTESFTETNTTQNPSNYNWQG